MAGKKINDLTALGRDLASTDLLELSLAGGTGSRKITGQQIINAIPSGITIGTTAITSGTVGRVLFQGTGNVVQQSSSLFWDNTNARLGIGTSSPAFALDVVGSSRFLENVNYPQIILGRTNTRFASLTWDDPASEALFQTFSRAFPFVFDASLIRFMSNGLERMRVFNSGNIGINTTTDAGFKFDVNGTARVQGNAQFGTAFYWDNTNGRLGIGTSSPATGLDARSGFNLWVGGGHYLTGTAVSGTDASMVFRRTADNGWVRYALSSTGVASFGYDAGTGETQLTTSNFLTFLTNSVERLRIFKTTGNVVINTTTDAGFKLDVNGTARVSGALTVSGNQILFSGSTSNTYITQNIGTGVGNLSAALCMQIQVNTFPKIIVRDTGASRASTLIVGDNVATTEAAHSSALLEVRSSSAYIRGFLPPRMTTTEKNSIPTPAAGLMVYDTTLNLMSVYNGTTWITL